MNTEIHWGRVGVLVVAIIGIASIAFVAGRKTNVSAPAVSNTPVITKQDSKVEIKKNTAPQEISKDTITYKNEQFGFTMEFPKSWEGYNVNVSSSNVSNGALVGIEFPSERFSGNLVDKTLKKVRMFDINAYPKALYEKDQLVCQKNKVQLDEEARKEALGKPYTSTLDQDIVFMCSHIDINNLGSNDKFHFSYRGLGEMDNGFKDVSQLQSEVDAVIRTFKIIQ